MLSALRVVTNGRDFWSCLLLAVVSAGFQAGAVLVLFPLGRALFGGAPAASTPWVALLAGLVGAAWGVEVLAARSGLRVGLDVMHAIQRRTPDAVLQWPDLDHRRVAALRSLVSSGATEAPSGVILLVIPAVTAVGFTVLLGIGLLAVSGAVAAVTLLGGGLALLALWASAQLEVKAQLAYTRASEELDDRLFEFAWAQPSLRTSRNLTVGRRFVEQAIDRTRRRVLGLLGWQIPSEFLFSLVTQVVLLGFGFTVWLAYSGGVVGAVDAAVLVIVLLRVLEQVRIVAGTVTGMVTLSQSLGEVRRIIETKPWPRQPPLPGPPHVEASGLELTYPNGAVGLAKVSLELKPGTVTVVVGASGSGKSTLLRVLAGLRDVDAGTIALDGEAPGETLNLLRSNAAVVFQDPVLTDASLRENLLAIAPDLADPKLDEIAEAAMLAPILRGSPKGWDTPAGELGAGLSGGERQRVGFARALAKQARLLLIDEATSALDSHNERAIVESICRIRERYTTVVVTHRPMLLDLADVVVVMRDGRIVEQGPPAELEAAGGEFARLRRQWREAARWKINATPREAAIEG